MSGLGVPTTLRKVRRPGGIVAWEGPRPPEDDDTFWDRLAAALAASHLDFRPVTGVLCECGCLLRGPDETCPACLHWAERNAAEHAQRRPVIYYRTINRESEAA